MMHKENIIHAIIDCQLCNKILTQYLNEDPVFEVIITDTGSTIDACKKCADAYYEKDK